MNHYEWACAAAVALLLIGTGVRLAAPASPVAPVPPEIPTLPAIVEDGYGAGRAAAQGALARNVFSAARSAPPARFRLGADELDEMMDAPAVVVDFQPPPPPPPQFRVAGTATDGSGGLALIAADPQARAPQVYRVGDAVGGYRLEQIAYDHVVLVGAAGEIRLDVARPGQAQRAAAGAAAMPGQFQGPVPNAAHVEVPIHQRATSAANTPPGAIPPGW
jgi:hypothetical protein